MYFAESIPFILVSGEAVDGEEITSSVLLSIYSTNTLGKILTPEVNLWESGSITAD